MTTILEKSGFNRDKKYKIVGTSPVKHDGIDKVTGRAKFGADLFLPGMLVGKILRSPHAHARIKSIDVSAAQRLAGVKAVVTRDDFPEMKPGTVGGDMSRNAMAREKALYDGHPVAAVAAATCFAAAHHGSQQQAGTWWSRATPGRAASVTGVLLLLCVGNSLTSRGLQPMFIKGELEDLRVCSQSNTWRIAE